jgi:hypothetical protein
LRDIDDKAEDFDGNERMFDEIVYQRGEIALPA